MIYSVDILRPAKKELFDAAGFYREISPKLATDLLFEFYEQLDIVARNPLIYQVIRKDYRKANLIRFPYKIVSQSTKQPYALLLSRTISADRTIEKSDNLTLSS
jgi:hypothetical protein